MQCRILESRRSITINGQVSKKFRRTLGETAYLFVDVRTSSLVLSF